MLATEWRSFDYSDWNFCAFSRPQIPIWPILLLLLEKIRGRENSCPLCSLLLECPTFTSFFIDTTLFEDELLVSRLPSCHVAIHLLSSCRKYYLIRPYRRNAAFPQTVTASQQFVISLPVCSLKLIKKNGCIELLYRWVHATSANISFSCSKIFCLIYEFILCPLNCIPINGFYIRWGGKKRDHKNFMYFTWTCSMK